MTVIKHFIDGKLHEGSSQRKGKIFDPATGDQLTEVNLASKADIDLAVQKVLDEGLRTKDIMSSGKKEVTTSVMGDAIISKLK